MKFLVTGVHRELGRSVAEQLVHEGHDVLRLGRTSASGVQNACAQAIDAIVHADISLSASRDKTAIDDNLFGVRHLVELTANSQTPLIVLSSIVAQGPSSNGLPHENIGRDAPNGMIARSIRSAEMVLWNANLSNLTIFRLGIPYGFDGAFAEICSAIRRSKVRPLFNPLGLTFIHVGDIASAIIARAGGAGSPRLHCHLSDGVVRSGSDLLNALEMTDEVVFHMPTRLNGRLLRWTGELSRPFDIWDMTAHLSHGGYWTSVASQAETDFGFAPLYNWTSHLRQTP